MYFKNILSLYLIVYLCKKQKYMKDNPIITIDSEYIEWLKAIKQQILETKLLQKSEMRKNMVMDLIYRGFIYAANYSESHYNPRRSQIKTELRYLFVTTPNR